MWIYDTIVYFFIIFSNDFPIRKLFQCSMYKQGFIIVLQSSFKSHPLWVTLEIMLHNLYYIINWVRMKLETDILSSDKHYCRNILLCTIYNIFSLKFDLVDKIIKQLIKKNRKLVKTFLTKLIKKKNSKCKKVLHH